jgi:hypothetical protein
MPTFSKLLESLNAANIPMHRVKSFNKDGVWRDGKMGWKFDDSIKAKIEGREEIKMQDANAQ